MNYDLLSPYVRAAISSYLTDPFSINWRSLLDYELIYIQEGSFLLQTDQESLVCHEGDILLLCPGVSHRIDTLGSPVLQPHIHFDLICDELSPQVYVSYKPLSEFTPMDQRFLRPNLFAHMGLQSPLLRVPNPTEILIAMEDIITLEQKKPPLHRLKQKAAMLELLALLLEKAFPRISRETHDSGVSALREVKDYIDHNAGSVITLDSLALHFH